MPGRFGPADLSIAEDIARRAAANIEHAYLYRDARQFIATVDATLDAVFMFEPASLRFTYVNQGAVAQVGYERGQLLAMRAIDIKPDFDEARYRELLAPLIDGSRDHLTFNTVHRHREGFDIPVEVFLQHVRLPGGEARMIITSRDIRAQIDIHSLYRLARGERARAAELNAVIQGMSDGARVRRRRPGRACEPGRGGNPWRRDRGLCRARRDDRTRRGAAATARDDVSGGRGAPARSGSLDRDQLGGRPG